jgi:hypothetical protein
MNTAVALYVNVGYHIPSNSESPSDNGSVSLIAY